MNAHVNKKTFEGADAAQQQQQLDDALASSNAYKGGKKNRSEAKKKKKSLRGENAEACAPQGKQLALLAPSRTWQAKMAYRSQCTNWTPIHTST